MNFLDSLYFEIGLRDVIQYKIEKKNIILKCKFVVKLFNMLYLNAQKCLFKFIVNLLNQSYLRIRKRVQLGTRQQLM